jgi:competence protein ComEC
VGIVALLVNGLLILLGLVRRGHIWRNVIAILAIWAYALLAGGSPSVIRAAMMFSGAQIAYASSGRYDGTNILLATASVMLIINSNYLFNISFQLSFTAVAGIFVLYRPLYDFVKTRYRVLNLLWATIIIGIAASLATAPLVSYYFGRISLIGIVLNPVVIASAHVIVCVSLIWVIAPLGFMNGIFGSVLTWVTEFQNSVVAVTAQQSWGIANIRFNLTETLAVYAIMIAIFIISRKYLIRHNDAQRYKSAHKRPNKAKH